MLLNYITWNPDLYLIDLGFIGIRYYSLFFMLAFFAGYIVVKKQFKVHHVDLKLLDSLTIYVFLGTLIGARLGHCLFYDFDYFSKHPLEIFLPVSFTPTFHVTGFQGLASHGGGIGVLISLYLFSQKFKINLWFLLDQIALAIPLAGTCIRLGNLMNSEIIGKPTDVNWAFIFVQVDNIPRHPAQLYEAIAYFLIFLIMYFILRKNPKPPGFYFGTLLVLLFSSRLLIEFVKESQSAFENGWPLNMGQFLSIPFIIVGVAIIVIQSRKSARL
ncbi:MAG: prolipoprotein diacylglyceryl transferase [Sphingobacterium sp.]